MPDHILLTGASGFIAKHIALKALNAGHAVRGTLRRMDRAGEVRAALRPWLKDAALLDRLTFAPADLERDAGWPEAMAGITALMHTASPFPLTAPKEAARLIRPALEGTRRVLHAAHAAGVGRVVLTSSVAAIMGAQPDRALTEEDWADPTAPATSAYARSKTLAERAAWEIAAQTGLRLTTINPGFVLGPPLDGTFGASLGLVQRLLRGRDPMLPDLGFPVVDVRDVADAHVAALGRPATAGRRFIVASGTMTMVQMARVLKAEYPVRRIPTRQAPAALLRIIALWDPAVRGILPQLGRAAEVSNHRAISELGLTLIAPDVALKASADWLVRAGLVWA